MNKIKLVIIFALLAFSINSFAGETGEPSFERRMAIDVGSGSTKFAIADVDPKTNRVVQTVFEGSFPVPYQKHLQSFDGSFDEEIQRIGLETFHKIKELKDTYSVEKVKVVATEAFRNAVNAEEYAAKVSQETAFKIEIIPQK